MATHDEIEALKITHAEMQYKLHRNWALTALGYDPFEADMLHPQFKSDDDRAAFEKRAFAVVS